MLGNRVEADEIARRFVRARASGSALPEYPGTVPADLDSAYAIQDAAIALVKDSIAGWKVGRIQPPRSEHLGDDRLSGPIFAASVQKIGDRDQNIGAIYADGFGAAEAEFVFRIGTPPKPDQHDLTLEETAELVDSVYVGFEIASSPFAGINGLGPLVTISDFGNNNGLILGPEIADWRNAGLESWTVETRADGHLLGAGQAASFPDGPLGSVRFLIGNLRKRGIAIAPGLLVSTGAVSGVHEVIAGQHIVSRFGVDLQIECRIAHA